MHMDLTEKNLKEITSHILQSHFIHKPYLTRSCFSVLQCPLSLSEKHVESRKLWSHGRKCRAKTDAKLVEQSKIAVADEPYSMFKMDVIAWLQYFLEQAVAIVDWAICIWSREHAMSHSFHRSMKHRVVYQSLLNLKFCPKTAHLVRPQHTTAFVLFQRTKNFDFHHRYFQFLEMFTLFYANIPREGVMFTLTAILNLRGGELVSVSVTNS